MKQLRLVEQNLQISAEAKQWVQWFESQLKERYNNFPSSDKKADDAPWELDELERTIIDYVIRLVSRGGSPLGILKKFYKKIQPFYDFYYEYTACKKGCGGCCYIHVDVSQLECNLIDEYLGRKKNDRHDFYVEDIPDKEHIKCPFLQHNTCSIYPVRPFLCRNYMIIPDKTGICSILKDKPESEWGSTYIRTAYEIICQHYSSPVIDLKKYYADLS